MFEKVPSTPDLVAGEHEVLKFWQETNAFEKLRVQNAGKPKWSFLDGPITANNPMGVHHAWGRTLKDAFQRYFAMTGHDQRYQNGFDCQGLWVEVEVEKELGLQSKRDIENLVPGDRFASIDRFVTECKRRVDKFARRQTEQSIRLGYWMDWDREEDWTKPPDQRRSYFTMSEENNDTIWAFLKKCHQRGLIYKAFDSMPWCPRCAVGISQMEMHEGYVFVSHRAVFLRFPLRGRPGENLLVWTTTPWTLTSNIAAAVNPALTYVKVKHRDQIYYFAKGALTCNRLEDDFKRGNWVEGVPKLKSVAQIFKEKGGYEIVGELRGSEMVGWTYDGPFDELAAQSRPFGFPAQIAHVVEQQTWSPAISGKDAHRIIEWDLVGETEGTGIVHIAPGCGKDDFELGKVQGLPPIAPLNEEGLFLSDLGPLSGKAAYAHETVDQILESLTQKGLLVAVERYPHNYPHCWRCKTELLFRLVDEWYISMSWREEIMNVCHDIQWIPDFGLQRELDWLKNMGDWMISKKRYWGLALPIWVCDSEACGAFDVVGDRAELRRRATSGWEKFDCHSAHRPWVDLVKIHCSKCGGTASRIPDVGNPWLDAGIVPFSTMKYNTDREYWQQWFPADFITECFPGQFRNWFYALLAMSTMMEQRAPFRVLLGHALVRDEHGEEMHKSKGNAIWFDDAAEQMGVDVMRWLYCRQNPTQNLNFGYTPGREVERQVFNTLWNSYAFFVNYARLDEFDPATPPVPFSERPEIDRWILSNLQSLVQTARVAFQAFDTPAVVRPAEQFIESLSNWYIRRSRPRFWRSRNADDRDKLAAYQTLYEVLVTLCKLLAPIIPFLTERVYQNLIIRPSSQHLGSASVGSLPCESVHHCNYPEPQYELQDSTLSFQMEVVKDVVAAAHAMREQAGHRVRQPLAELCVAVGNGDGIAQALDRMRSLVMEELNVKSLKLVENLNDLSSLTAKANFGVLGPRLGKEVQKVAASIARASTDVVRKLQSGLSVTFECDGQTYEVWPAEVAIQETVQAGWILGQAGHLRVALKTTLTPELRREGLARDVVRHIQQLRKDTGLNIEDRIEVAYRTESAELLEAIEEWRSYVMPETLCTNLVNGSFGLTAKEVQLGQSKLGLELRRMNS
ncbi:MAG: isoleucine--tRNA ligase [Planctomycetes bacterium]|nr:isoleucine--tRNA ligase [Planctomycetota bacterium]